MSTLSERMKARFGHTGMQEQLGVPFVSETTRIFERARAMANLPGMAVQRLGGLVDYLAGVPSAVVDAVSSAGLRVEPRQQARLVAQRPADARQPQIQGPTRTV